MERCRDSALFAGSVANPTVATQAAQLKEKDPELGEVAERIINEFSETRGAPPGFEQAAASASDPLAVQPDAATGVQLAEQALAEPSGAPTLAAVAAGMTPEPETSSQHAAQQMTAPGPSCMRLLWKQLDCSTGSIAMLQDSRCIVGHMCRL